MARFFRSSRTRILGWILVPVLLLLALILSSTFALLTNSKQNEIDSHFDREALELSLLAAEGINPETNAPFERAEDVLDLYIARTVPDEHEAMFITVNSEPTARANGDLEIRLEGDESFLDVVNSVTTATIGTYESAEGSFRYLVVPIVGVADQGALVGYVSNQEAFEDLRELFSQLTWASLLALVSAGSIGWLVAGGVLRPISKIRESAHKINATNLLTRIEVSEKGGEIAELSMEFNGMLERLESSFKQQQQFVDDAGHELRTPLTIISGHFDLMETQTEPSAREHSVQVIRQEIDRMSRIVKDLQALTKSSQADFIKPSPTRIEDLADSLIVKAEVMGKRVFNEFVTPDVSWNLDEQRITQAVLQLVSNAVKHTVDDDTILISLAVQDEVLTISVDDSGAGFPMENRERLTERFVRGNHQAPQPAGAGLGLAVVRAIAEGHGGTLEISDSKLGGGRVAIVLRPTL